MAHTARTLCLAILTLLLAGTALGQISPGPLARSHQSLAGATNCSTCHKLGAGEAQFRCLECHTEIAGRLAAKKGLHATFGLAPGSSQGCVRCHSDHNGESFPLVKWDPPQAQFDHRKTGYTLEGKHTALACNQCHNPTHVDGAMRTAIRVRDLNRTFLGLSPACASCHRDQHEGRLGTACQQCHNSNDWKNVSQFDHAKTKFPLTGLHAQVTCAKCHTPGADQKPRYTGIPFSKCVDCHADRHNGAFTQGCQACHNTNGWKRVQAGTLNAQFDHSKTKYPLTGKHQEVGCSQCHANGDFKKPLAFPRCMDCHKPDPHGGQFARRTDGGECSSCHTVEGFKPAKFGVKDHALTAYPLEYKHAEVECGKCHLPKGKDTLYKVRFDRCVNCHRDEHEGQFTAAPYLNKCDSCHTLKGYRPSTYSLQQHQKLAFSLTGAHIAIACTECHKPRDPVLGRPAAQFHWQNLACTSCHHDPHRDQFFERMRVLKDGKPVGCEACHSTDTWKDLSRFDHAKTTFPLVGTHRATACIDCHKPPNLETRLIHVDFKAAPTDCKDCHADPHAGQFAKAGAPAGCASCHNTTKWKPSLFDHDKTALPLQGVHRNVRCELCHKLTREIEGKAVLFYKPTPKDCAACHGSDKQPAR